MRATILKGLLSEKHKAIGTVYKVEGSQTNNTHTIIGT